MDRSKGATMLDEFIEFAEWKYPNGTWNKQEIAIDLAVVAGIIGSLYYIFEVML